MNIRRWSRPTLWLGTAGVVLGAVDPMEGSVLIAAGAVALVAGAHIGHLHARRLLDWGGALTALGVAVLWAMTVVGGVGGPTGRSEWWALLALPYPIGWLLSLTGAYRALRER